MAANNLPEIPQALRDLTVKNIDRARAAYTQLMDAAQGTGDDEADTAIESGRLCKY